MYCILNQSNDLVASDLEFLKLFGTNNLVNLYKKITAEDAKISLDYDKITLTVNNNINIYDIKVTPLATLFGKSVLVELMSENIKNEFIKAPIFTDMTPLDEEPTDTILSPTKAEETIEPLATLEESPAKDVPGEEETVVNEPILEQMNIENISIQENEYQPEENENIEHLIDPNITLDISEIAKSMHLSDGDYSVFLNEYTSSIDKFKNDLLCEKADIKENALNFIKHVTTALHLPKEIEDLVYSLKVGSSTELLQNFFDVIDNIKKQNAALLAPVKEGEAVEITASKTAQEIAPIEEIQILPINQKPISIDIAKEQEHLPEIQIEPQETLSQLQEIDLDTIELETPKAPTISQPEQKMAEKSGTGDKINLENVKPLPFDFILDESAKELSLPVDIVKEFIKDFIEQCHADTTKILHKHEEGDIEKIKKLAHSLKGVSSNLYIMPLADTLLELQNNDDLSQVKPLVEKYWGHFLYLENLMKNI